MKKKILKHINLYFLILICIFGIISCASVQRRHTLDESSKEFLSKVRYIINKQEKKIFLNLPPSERQSFVEKFWKKRDYDPDTEINEFKEEYFGRIEEADKLFKEGTTPGWLTDRGRIYILLGPPHQRLVHEGYHDAWSERWYYENITIDFVERDLNGTYELMDRSAYNLGKIQKMVSERRLKINKKYVVFDFILEISKSQDGYKLLIRIPYKCIWMAEKEGKLKTTLNLAIQTRNASKEKIIGEYFKSYSLSLKEEQLEKLYDQKYLIEVPFKPLEGDYIMVIQLENLTGQDKVMKKIKFSI